MKLRNFTPHICSIADGEGRIVCQISSEGNARVSTSSIAEGEVEVEGFMVPVVRTVFGEIEGLPNPEEGTYLIVSQIVIAAVPDRGDLVRPDTGPTCIRDGEGRIVAVRGLTR